MFSTLVFKSSPVHSYIFLNFIWCWFLQSLSDKSRFELFARVVPPDTFQVKYWEIILKISLLQIKSLDLHYQLPACHRPLPWWTLSISSTGPTSPPSPARGPTGSLVLTCFKKWWVPTPSDRAPDNHPPAGRQSEHLCGGPGEGPLQCWRGEV